MAKRKTIKPVKAWGVLYEDGVLAHQAWPLKHNAEHGARLFSATGGIVSKARRVTVSVDDPAATRLSAAQRRVAELEREVAALRGALKSAVDAGTKSTRFDHRTERAKGDRK